MKKCKSFKIQELVPPDVFKSHGEDAWAFVDPKLIDMVDLLKERFPKGTITINNYLWNGSRVASGLRIPTNEHYSKTSQHALHPVDLVFRAVDCLFSDYDAEDVRQDIKDNPDVYVHVRGLEDGVSWLHMDTRNRNELLVFTA